MFELILESSFYCLHLSFKVDAIISHENTLLVHQCEVLLVYLTSSSLPTSLYCSDEIRGTAYTMQFS
uniref:Putative ovule protein n=1 Tax=Solanum chacoense TaxID=4108 RepID=A0A0V0GMG7_SOLCH